MLGACSDTHTVAVRPYGNDALPSPEVTAFEAAHRRLAYADARIEHDAANCAVYRGRAPGGQVRGEPLRDPDGRPICPR